MRGASFGESPHQVGYHRTMEGLSFFPRQMTLKRQDYEHPVTPGTINNFVNANSNSINVGCIRF
jgi:hypothetical protein